MKLLALVVPLALIAWLPVARTADPAGAETLGSFSSGLDGWQYNGGWEFKGSKGRLIHQPSEGHDEPGAASLAGEFDAGGTYVAMTRNGTFSEPAEVRFWIKSNGLQGLDVRLADAQQQFFQYAVALDPSTDWQEVVIHLSGTPPKSHWGGPNDGIWSGGLTKMWICLPRRFCGEDKTGSCLVDDIRLIPRP